MVACSSHVDHMILEGCYMLEVMGSCSDWHSGGGLGCDGLSPTGPVGSDWDQSEEPIRLGTS